MLISTKSYGEDRRWVYLDIGRFGGLAEGESMQITFELVMPDVRGKVGNAVTVYDGSEPSRARGTRIEVSLG